MRLFFGPADQLARISSSVTRPAFHPDQAARLWPPLCKAQVHTKTNAWRRSRYHCDPVLERGELMPLLREGSVETLRDHKSTQQSSLPYECGTMSHPLPSCFPLRLDSAPARCFRI